ncbi:MAG TPA: hypothetical protein VM223_23695 [Planctomycetota bacterium]|nr:hypothetical protein [Planctomycetota bacterium]
MKHIFCLSVACLLCILLTACQPSEDYVWRADGFSTQVLQGKTLLLVNDVVITRLLDNGKDEYVCLSDSKRVLEKTNRALMAYMAAQGHPIPEVGPCGIGGFLDPANPYEVASYPFCPTRAGRPPLLLDTKWQKWLDNGASELEADLLRPIYRDYPPNPKTPEHLSRDEKFRRAVREVGNQYKCDLLLLVASRGRIVYRQEQMRKGLPQMIGTAVLSLGTFSGAVMPADYILTYAVLMDAKTGDLLWANVYPFGGQESDKVFELYGGARLTFDEQGKADEKLVGPIADPELRAWISQKCNMPWMDWSRNVLFPLSEGKKEK